MAGIGRTDGAMTTFFQGCGMVIAVSCHCNDGADNQLRVGGRLVSVAGWNMWSGLVEARGSRIESRPVSCVSGMRHAAPVLFGVHGVLVTFVGWNGLTLG